MGMQNLQFILTLHFINISTNATEIELKIKDMAGKVVYTDKITKGIKIKHKIKFEKLNTSNKNQIKNIN